MPNDLLIYEFADLRYSPLGGVLENLETGKQITLPPKLNHFLLALIQKSPEVAEYEDLRKMIWVEYVEMTDSLKRLMQTTKHSLVKYLEKENFPSDFIGNVQGCGYRLEAEVQKVSAATEDLPKDEILSEAEDESETYVQADSEVFDGNHKSIYAISFSLFYGLLFWIALLLECAYQFDKYKSEVLWSAAPLIVINSAMMFLVLSRIKPMLQKEYSFVLPAGVLCLVGGVVISCFLASTILPNEPITLANFQTQPALPAYTKNCLLYFLPLGIFFILLPFYAVSGRQLSKDVVSLSPKFLFIMLIVFFFYSILTTFYLFDNLLPSEYHGLFVMVMLIRFFLYFGLAAAGLLWYYANFEKVKEFI